MRIDYISTPEQLEPLCHSIRQQPWLALDTEFLREKTYYPQFCLLQIATPEWVACVDPIALPQLDPLFETLYQPAIIKVFHSCRQDLEIFYHLYGKLPAPIFDTQVAAPLLGFQDNPGYGMLVSSLLNINLSKAHTRADWSKRPLAPAELKYAADDVIYLCKIYQIMLAKLAELGRSDWLDDDFKALSEPAHYRTDPENAWLKIKGKNKLTGKQLAIMQALATWRESTAQAENRPKNWLLRDELLLDLAKLQPETVTELAAVRSVNERTAHRYGKEICRLIDESKKHPPIPLHEQGKPLKKSQQQEAILDILSALVRIRAEENSLNPSILASRKDLEQLLFKEDDEDCPLLHGWRYSMAGKELVGLLAGQSLLGIADGTLAISLRN